MGRRKGRSSPEESQASVADGDPSTAEEGSRKKKWRPKIPKRKFGREKSSQSQPDSAVANNQAQPRNSEGEGEKRERTGSGKRSDEQNAFAVQVRARKRAALLRRQQRWQQKKCLMLTVFWVSVIICSAFILFWVKTLESMSSPPTPTSETAFTNSIIGYVLMLIVGPYGFIMLALRIKNFALGTIYMFLAGVILVFLAIATARAYHSWEKDFLNGSMIDHARRFFSQRQRLQPFYNNLMEKCECCNFDIIDRIRGWPTLLRSNDFPHGCCRTTQGRRNRQSCGKGLGWTWNKVRVPGGFQVYLWDSDVKRWNKSDTEFVNVFGTREDYTLSPFCEKLNEELVRDLVHGLVLNLNEEYKQKERRLRRKVNISVTTEDINKNWTDVYKTWYNVEKKELTVSSLPQEMQIKLDSFVEELFYSIEIGRNLTRGHYFLFKIPVDRSLSIFSFKKPDEEKNLEARTTRTPRSTPPSSIQLPNKPVTKTTTTTTSRRPTTTEPPKLRHCDPFGFYPRRFKAKREEDDDDDPPRAVAEECDRYLECDRRTNIRSQIELDRHCKVGYHYLDFGEPKEPNTTLNNIEEGCVVPHFPIVADFLGFLFDPPREDQVPCRCRKTKGESCKPLIPPTTTTKKPESKRKKRKSRQTASETDKPNDQLNLYYATRGIPENLILSNILWSNLCERNVNLDKKLRTFGLKCRDLRRDPKKVPPSLTSLTLKTFKNFTAWDKQTDDIVSTTDARHFFENAMDLINKETIGMSSCLMCIQLILSIIFWYYYSQLKKDELRGLDLPPDFDLLDLDLPGLDDLDEDSMKVGMRIFKEKLEENHAKKEEEKKRRSQEEAEARDNEMKKRGSLLSHTGSGRSSGGSAGSGHSGMWFRKKSTVKADHHNPHHAGAAAQHGHDHGHGHGLLGRLHLHSSSHESITEKKSPHDHDVEKHAGNKHHLP